jgi:hypothetical protein
MAPRLERWISMNTKTETSFKAWSDHARRPRGRIDHAFLPQQTCSQDRKSNTGITLEVTMKPAGARHVKTDGEGDKQKATEVEKSEERQGERLGRRMKHQARVRLKWHNWDRIGSIEAMA